MINEGKTVVSNTIMFDHKKLEQFRRAYQKAVEDKAEVFVFEEKEIITAYGKYMLEYLSPKLR